MSDYNPKASIKLLRQIYLAIFLSPILLFLVIFLPIDISLSAEFDITEAYHFGLLVMLVIVIPTALYFSNKYKR